MNIDINYRAIQEIALRGVRRTAVFIGLGLNASLDPNMKDYELTNLSLIQIVPSNADEKTLTHYKEQFSIWIIACGLRELMESFAIFLDEVYCASLSISASLAEISIRELTKRDKNYRNKGIKEKLDLLLQEFDIKSNHNEILKTIHQTRNCLVHRQGKVGTEDCFGDQFLTVRWMGFDVSAEIPSGEVISLYPVPKEGIFFSEGAQVKVTVIERIKTFPLGNIVTFSPNTLAEMCHFVLTATTEILKSAEIYATKKGILVPKNSDNLD